MNRCDFLKWLAGMLAAPTALLAAGKVKPKFPRYFVPIFWPENLPHLVYVRVCSATDLAWAFCADRPPNETRIRLADLEERVRQGRWKEITAAEAKALLKPFRPHAQPDGVFTFTPPAD